MGWEGTADSMWEGTVTYKSTQPVGCWVVPCRACVCTRLVSKDTSLVAYSLCISKVLEEAWLNMGRGAEASGLTSHYHPQRLCGEVETSLVFAFPEGRFDPPPWQFFGY